MTALKASARIRVFGTENSWSLAPHFQGGKGEGRECTVELEIVGDPETGYHLIKSPVGFFAADDWYLTLEGALDAGREDFGIAAGEWAAESPDGAS